MQGVNITLATIILNPLLAVVNNMRLGLSNIKQKKEQQQKGQENVIILFVCVENAGRSQMAEGFFNQRYAPKDYRAISAGTRPVPSINPLAVQAMSEVGIDISSQKSKLITEDMIKSAAQSVNMGCIERAECPMLFINNLIDWGIEDPKGKPIEKVREIRDEIDRRVKEIAESLKRQNCS
jgi:arsenate reductase